MSEPHWTRPAPGKEAPGSVHKRHECPPDRMEMARRLAELEARWNTRLANQKQVIANLEEDRVRVMGQRDTLFGVLKEMQRILTHDYDASDQLELWHQLKEMVNKAVES